MGEHRDTSGWGRPQQRPSPTVTVVVVTHESSDVIEECLASVLAVPDVVSREVVVVDNASTDGTADLVAQRFPSVQLIRKRSRHGFATNVNIGAAATESPYLFLLNPDTSLRPGALDGLVAHIGAEADVGIVGPKLVYPDGRPQWSARRFPSPLSTLVRRTPLRRWFPALADSHLLLELTDEPTDVDWMLGAALLIRRDVFDAVGGMDERFRLYCEDADLCWRAQEAGWRVQHLGHATVAHHLAQRTRKRFLTVLTVWHLSSILRFLLVHGTGTPDCPPSISVAPMPRWEPSYASDEVLVTVPAVSRLAV